MHNRTSYKFNRKKSQSTANNGNFRIFSKIKAKECTLFTRQLSTLINAGVPLLQALKITSDCNPNLTFKQLIQDLARQLEKGNSFANALRRYPQYFDTLYCGLIENAEQSGTMDILVARLANHQEKKDSLKRKIQKALYYPIAVLMIAIVVVGILLINIVPIFKEMFENYNAALPQATQFVLMLSNMLIHYGFYILTTCSLIVYCFYKLYGKNTNTALKTKIEKWQLKLPIFGLLLQKILIARFARTLSTTFSAGLKITEGLEAASKVISNIAYKKAIQRIKEDILTGQQMHVALKKNAIFPAMLIQMVRVGEETGKLETMLDNIALLYEDEISSNLEGLTSLLEPIMMLLLGVLIGGIMIAMYLPIFKMSSFL